MRVKNNRAGFELHLANLVRVSIFLLVYKFARFNKFMSGSYWNAFVRALQLFKWALLIAGVCFCGANLHVSYNSAVCNYIISKDLIKAWNSKTFRFVCLRAQIYTQVMQKLKTTANDKITMALRDEYALLAAQMNSWLKGVDFGKY